MRRQSPPSRVARASPRLIAKKTNPVKTSVTQNCLRNSKFQIAHRGLRNSKFQIADRGRGGTRQIPNCRSWPWRNPIPAVEDLCNSKLPIVAVEEGRTLRIRTNPIPAVEAVEDRVRSWPWRKAEDRDRLVPQLADPSRRRPPQAAAAARSANSLDPSPPSSTTTDAQLLHG